MLAVVCGLLSRVCEWSRGSVKWLVCTAVVPLDNNTNAASLLRYVNLPGGTVRLGGSLQKLMHPAYPVCIVVCEQNSLITQRESAQTSAASDALARVLKEPIR